MIPEQEKKFLQTFSNAITGQGAIGVYTFALVEQLCGAGERAGAAARVARRVVHDAVGAAHRSIRSVRAHTPPVTR